MRIDQLFPQPLYFSKLERGLTKEELREINRHKVHTDFFTSKWKFRFIGQPAIC